MLTDFRAGAEVRSVLAPYLCSSCSREEQREVVLSGTVSIPDSIKCPHCQGAMFFDDDPEGFLAFRQG